MVSCCASPSIIGEAVGLGASSAILQVGNLDRIVARTQIDEADIARVSKGARAYVTAPAYPGRRFGGEVTDVSPRLGAKTIQSGAPTEKRDASVLDVLVTLDPGTVLPVGLRVDCYHRRWAEPDMTSSPRPALRAVFTQGSILRHVAVMTLTSAVGLMAIFLIDLLSMFYVSLAHRDAWRAAVSLMSKVLFFPFALNMGMMIGIGTVVSVAIGAGTAISPGDRPRPVSCLTGLLGLGVSLGALPFRVEILHLFGAEGEALEAASRLLVWTLPVNVFLSIGMACASILRASGDPTRAMLVTLAGGVATAAADPLFIFGVGQGVDGDRHGHRRIAVRFRAGRALVRDQGASPRRADQPPTDPRRGLFRSPTSRCPRLPPTSRCPSRIGM